ncbi:MAG TPA: hypothetical protein ENJ11_10440 [Gammaproteobacteria bacterium]|nr:hypothetical protein [Gammaproteobacteria bacterium]
MSETPIPKPDLQTGAYGWLHRHWQGSYYPDDLPEDWQLGYYSNDFNTVLVPAADLVASLAGEQVLPIEDWPDEVHENFRFYIECNAVLLETVGAAALIEHLGALQQQLAALVVGNAGDAGAQAASLQRLGDALSVPLYAGDSASDIFLLNSELKDLRQVRAQIEPFLQQLENRPQAEAPAAIFVRHPKLQAADLGRFRAMLEVMGY